MFARFARLDPARTVVVAAFLLGLAFSVPPTLNAARSPAGPAVGNKDYSLWYETGCRVLDGRPLYELSPAGEVAYMYPPTLAVFAFAPLATLGYVGFVACFAVGNAAAWALGLRLALRLVRGAGEPVSWPGALVPFLAGGVYAWDMFHLGQLNLFLLAAALLAWEWEAEGRPWRAGATLGLAAAAKVFPLPLVVYFAFRRNVAAVAATLLAMVAVLWLLPAPFRGLERNATELARWGQLMVGDQSGETMAARSSIGFGRRNQSLVSLSHRLLRPVEASSVTGGTLYVNVADVSPKVAQAVGFGACVLLGGVLLLSTRFRPATGSHGRGLEWGMVLTLAVLASPLSWTYFFGWLMPGWAAAARFCGDPTVPPRTRRRAVLACGVAAALLACAVSEQFTPVPQSYGVTAWGAVVLFFALAGMRWHLGGTAAPAQNPAAIPYPAALARL